jgi:hypothetical protein
MGYRDSMTVIEYLNGYSIGLVNDNLYNPDSADNPIQYDKFYTEEPYQDNYFFRKHGIFLIENDEIKRSVCVCSLGGHTGIHLTGSVVDGNRFLICCADSIFCLELPGLELNWVIKADHVTCFEIYKYESDYIVHGELEITRLDKNGKIVWKFSGSDIFTTPTVRDDFKLNGDVIEAVNWDGIKFTISAETGKSINT